MMMAYTDLVKFTAFGFCLWHMYGFTKAVVLHTNDLKDRTNHVYERLHLYSHVWVVTSGLIAIATTFITQGVHIVYQDILHDDSMVIKLEMVMNISLAMVAGAYSVAIKHFIAEETPYHEMAYYKPSKES